MWKCERQTIAPFGWRLIKAMDGGALFAPDDDRPAPMRAPARWPALTPPPPTTPATPAPASVTPATDWPTLAARFTAALHPDKLDFIARALGVSVPALEAIGIGWASRDRLDELGAGFAGDGNYPDGAFSFPERKGAIVGFSFRTMDGRKGSPKGARRGLIVPANLADMPGVVLIVEGASDVAACLTLGIAAVGRPSNASGAEDLAELLREREVLIVGERDQKPDGRWPGRDGAVKIAEALARLWDKPVAWTLPPETTKDIREAIAGDIDVTGGTLMDALEGNIETIEPPKAETAGPVLQCLADFEPRRVAWLWSQRIPLGRISLLVGRPGEGKSFTTADMASRVTTGTDWPDGTPCPKGSVILVSGEDDPHDVIRPRLDAHHADVSRVHLLAMVRRLGDNGKPYETMFTLHDLDALETALKTVGDCLFIVVDPIGSFIGGTVDSHRDNEVRAVLAPLAKLAERYGCAVLIVAHTRKGSADFADDTALGSRAFTGIARTTWHLSRDKQDKTRRLLLPGKNNLAPEGDGLAFTIAGEPPALHWEKDPVCLHADDLMRPEGDDAPTERDDAAQWLRDLLAGGPRAAATVESEAKAAGYSMATVRRAKAAIGVESRRFAFDGAWLWVLPDDAQGAHQAPNTQQGEHLGAQSAEIHGKYPKALTSESVSILGEHLGSSEHLGNDTAQGAHAPQGAHPKALTEKGEHLGKNPEEYPKALTTATTLESVSILDDSTGLEGV